MSAEDSLVVDEAMAIVMVMNESGVSWEGKEAYKSFEELLQDLSKGIRQWNEDNV